MMYVFICIYSGQRRSNHKSLERRGEMHSNARYELTDLELSTCDRITQDDVNTSCEQPPRYYRVISPS